MIIGTYVDGRVLEYDESIYQFTIGRAPVSLSELRTMDTAGQISWNMQEQRDWMHALDEQVFNSEHSKAIGSYPGVAQDPQAQTLYGQGMQGSGQAPQGAGPVPPTNAQPYYMPQNPQNQPQGQAQKNSTKTILIIVGVVVAILLLCCCSCGYGCVGLLSDPNNGAWVDLDAIERYADELDHSSLNGSYAQDDLMAPIYLDELE